ncbi:T9SS type A sorting domain-containing protein [Aquimarina brevivitae]|uniref:Putative secreted protein (Por secretion system target) n=1 Tax=Aquimarina brevivitae TaxID=323412 RepID=A0A4Q7P3C0_9FLAO|nr:T9SS type A sorting domain-containing protein [Aquimarina brevivitae]RZS93900.1 putative secreted protein (Por secretion system target) [Aquimarina brevivitae]
MKLNFSFFLLFVIALKTVVAQENSKSYLDCDSNILEVTLEIYNNRSKLVLPESYNLVTEEEYGSIILNICAQDYRTTNSAVEHLNLLISFPFINTTLDPVEIPPPPPPGERTDAIKNNANCFFSRSIQLPWDAYQDDFRYDEGLPPGRHNFSLYLRNKSEIIDQKENIPFLVYSFDDLDLVTSIVGIFKSTSNNSVLVQCTFENMLAGDLDYDNSQTIALYVSNDAVLDANDRLLTKRSWYDPDEFFIEISASAYNTARNKYLIAQIDPYNQYEEVCENNNSNVYRISQAIPSLPEHPTRLLIGEARVFEDHSGRVRLSCLVKNHNAYDSPDDIEIGVFYKKNNGQEALLVKKTMKKLPPRSTISTLFYVPNRGFNWFNNRELKFVIDPYQKLIENTRKDNIRRIANRDLENANGQRIRFHMDYVNKKGVFTYTVFKDYQFIQINLYDFTSNYVTTLFIYGKPKGQHTLEVPYSHIKGAFYYSAIFGTDDYVSSDWIERSHGQLYHQYNGKLHNLVVSLPDISYPDNSFSRRKTKTEEIVVYPNPFQEKVNLAIPAIVDANVELKIYTTTGKLIDEKKIIENNKSSQNFMLYDGSQLSSGSYIYKLTVNKTTYEGTLIKN